jgi:hypothetical protein
MSVRGSFRFVHAADDPKAIKPIKVAKTFHSPGAERSSNQFEGLASEWTRKSCAQRLRLFNLLCLEVVAASRFFVPGRYAPSTSHVGLR